MIVNPAPGALVRDPVTKLVLQPGAEVDHNDPYFARAIADRDLEPAPTLAKTPARRGAQHEDRG